MAGAWNRMNIEIRGEINSVDILAFENGTVRTLKKITLS
jgi:hypothetical protein